MTGLKTDKDMGNFWAWFWHVAFWEATEALGLVGKEDFEQERFLHHLHPLPQGWNPVNKKLFPLTLIVGSLCQGARWQSPGLLSNMYTPVRS